MHHAGVKGKSEHKGVKVTQNFRIFNIKYLQHTVLRVSSCWSVCCDLDEQLVGSKGRPNATRCKNVLYEHVREECRAPVASTGVPSASATETTSCCFSKASTCTDKHLVSVIHLKTLEGSSFECIQQN